MADKKISQLTPATTPLAGTEELPIVQGGSTVKVSVNNLTAGKAVTASQLTVENNSSSDAVRITQTGAGNALVVEDSANPDATPFLINASGVAVTGSTTALTTQTGIARIQSTAISAFAGVVQGATATNAATIDLSRCRGTFNAPTIVSSGDSTGRISFGGHDGVAYIEAAKIEAAVDGTPGANDMPGRLVFSTTADGASSPTERMRITSAGNVGIGTSAPNDAARLDVSSTTSGFLPPRMTTTQRDAITSPPDGLMLYNTTTNKLQVRAASAWVDLH